MKQPKTRGELKQFLQAGEDCIVDAGVAEMTGITLKGWLNFNDFIIYPSFEKSSVVFASTKYPDGSERIIIKDAKELSKNVLENYWNNDYKYSLFKGDNDANVYTQPCLISENRIAYILLDEKIEKIAFIKRQEVK